MKYSCKNNAPKGQPIASQLALDMMLGKTFASVESYSFDHFADKDLHDIMVFTTADNEQFIFNHWQDCCEGVYIEDIAGELNDLAGAPLVQCEEVINSPDRGTTWTFYKFATVKGSVTVRWLGESNGYYSESVDIWHKAPEVMP
ncbi:hypothetical protein UFOVP418_2 [uncultured Caudovirales phage]|uniref:DUF7448 domain-containing protein n=1 Tax=uncultured Caudovirales phage TaxID=2100421 RepID=A0A6J5M382_9CAUD|nr:hypothetical protein UFOVP418_2 [uncultured Caudovirales phage]